MITRPAAALAAAACLGALAGGASAAGAGHRLPAPAARVAAPTTTCDVTKNGRKLGPTYVTSLKVQRVSCATGITIVRAYYSCRVKNGGVRGKCHSLVHGYKCTEQRQGISIQFDAKVTCTNGSRKVVHTYVQDT